MQAPVTGGARFIGPRVGEFPLRQGRGVTGRAPQRRVVADGGLHLPVVWLREKRPA